MARFQGLSWNTLLHPVKPTPKCPVALNSAKELALLAGRKLLVADHSPTIQKVVELTFQDEGVEVVSVSDGQEAIERIEQVGPDIILADVFMPRRSGYEVCEYIKQNEKLKHIPVMLLVGSFEPFDEAEARRVGADDILTKPFKSIRRLMDKVGDLVSHKPAATEAQPDSAEGQPAYAQEQQGLAEAQMAKPDEMIGDRSRAGQPVAEFFEEEVPTAELPKAEEPEPERLSTGELEVTTADTRPLPAGESFTNYVASRPDDLDKPRQESTSGTRENRNMESTARQSQTDSYLETGDVLLDLGSVGPPAVASSDDFVLDLGLDEAFASSAFATSSSSTPGFEPQLEAIESNWESQRDAQRVVPAYVASSESLYRGGEFAESSVPSVSSSVPERQDWIPDQHVSQVIPEETQSQTMAAPSEAMGSALPAGPITLEQLSPEVIDAIARRAVAHLSERAVQEIAWEVVPQLAELLIKRKLEEKESQPK